MPNRILRLLADAVGEMERSPRSASQIANRLRHDLISIEKRARRDADMAKMAPRCWRAWPSAPHAVPE
jgi:hypothetical protein